MVTRTTDDDRSEAYDSDPLVRTIEDFVRSLPAERRLYPDLWAEDLATKIREGVKDLRALPLGEVEGDRAVEDFEGGRVLVRVPRFDSGNQSWAWQMVDYCDETCGEAVHGFQRPERMRHIVWYAPRSRLLRPYRSTVDS